MRKILTHLKFKNFFTLFLLLLTVSVFAQTPMYYNFATNENTNYYPFGVTAGERVDWLYPAGNFNQPTGAPSGNITAIYIFMGFSNGNSNLTNVCVKMGQSNITTLPASYYTGQMDTVYFRSAVTLTSTIGQWMKITLDRPFLYDSTQSLIVGISQCSSSNQSVVVCQHSYSPNRRSYNFPGSCTPSYYGGDALAGNFGVDISPATPTCGYTWATNTSGTTNLLQAVCTVSDQVAWIAGATATVRKTIDGGTTWTNANPNTGVITGDVYNIFAIDANTAWLTTSPTATFIYRTTNGGTNWAQVFTQTGGFIDGIFFNNATTGFAYGDPVGARWSLWKSTNGGVNWDSTGMYNPQAGTEAGWNNAISVIGNNVWFGTNNTRIYHSTNYGATGSWTAQTTTGNLNTYAVWFTSATNGMCVGTLPQITTNGGTNWTNATAPGGTGNLTSVGGKGTYFWTTQGNNIYGTSNFGTNWAATGIGYTGTNAMWGTFVGNNANGCIAGWSVGAAGTLIKLNGIVIGITNHQNEVPKIFSLEQNYPNPFNPTTKIVFTMPKAGNVDLKVYDVLGKEVTTLVNEFKQAGKYSVDFNGTNLASGVYFYKIVAGDFTATKKMSLIK